MDASEYGVIRLSERTSHPVFPATPVLRYFYISEFR